MNTDKIDSLINKYADSLFSYTYSIVMDENTTEKIVENAFINIISENIIEQKEVFNILKEEIIDYLSMNFKQNYNSDTNKNHFIDGRWRNNSNIKEYIKSNENFNLEIQNIFKNIDIKDKVILILKYKLKLTTVRICSKLNLTEKEYYRTLTNSIITIKEKIISKTTKK